ncbi:MAG TPA: hypothetical protein VFB72_19365 [Verrucomicrobiae bacterium]|nr:hypothetical protein [Verrucomicrobiae bacterium]
MLTISVASFGSERVEYDLPNAMNGQTFAENSAHSSCIAMSKKNPDAIDFSPPMKQIVSPSGLPQTPQHRSHTMRSHFAMSVTRKSGTPFSAMNTVAGMGIPL